MILHPLEGTDKSIVDDLALRSGNIAEMKKWISLMARCIFTTEWKASDTLLALLTSYGVKMRPSNALSGIAVVPITVSGMRKISQNFPSGIWWVVFGSIL